MPEYSALTEVAPARQAGDQPSCSPVYKSKRFMGKDTAMAGINTLYEMFTASVAKFGGNRCLGKRPVTNGEAGDYVWWTYEETGNKVKDLAAGMAALGVATGSKVGVFGPNAPEWMVSMQACNRMSMTCVPLYDTLGENAIAYIINHAEIPIVFLYGAKLPQLVKALPNVGGLIKNVVYWGDANDEQLTEVKNSGITVHSFDELLSMGAEKPAEPVPPAADDLCTIMYTSGTTGDPKGVMLTHKAVLATVQSTNIFLQAVCPFDDKDVFLSYLPLAHIFDRTSEELFLHFGGAIGYWQGNIAKLVEDISACKPTLFSGVPRVFDRIYAGVMGQVSAGSSIKKFLFNYGYSRKLNFLKSGKSSAQASPFFDALVFSKIKGKLGGHVKLVVSGGAPIAKHTEEFLRVCFCCPAVQGYGLTETCAASMIAVPDTIDQMGTVGIPTPITEMRLESVPEMNYDALGDEPKGEILLKGDNNFQGYYKNEKGTSEVLESDGWFHTGDIATIVGDGALKIIDRKKNIFKLAQGEYVAVEKVEEIYKKCSSIDQIWVYGNSYKSCLVAVVVPQPKYVQSWASQNGGEGSNEDTIKMEGFKKSLLDEMTAIAKAGGLKGFEIVKGIHVDMQPFSVEQDTLTPTFKLKRPQLLKQYQKEVDEVYSSLE